MGNIISYDILQVTKTEARRSQVVGLYDKYRDVDLLAQIKAVQDGIGPKKQPSVLISQKTFLNKSFCKYVIVSLVYDQSKDVTWLSVKRYFLHVLH